MTKQLDRDKQRVRTKRFERYRTSGLSVGKFCESEHVSVQSYYYWLRKLDRPERTQDRQTIASILICIHNQAQQSHNVVGLAIN